MKISQLIRAVILLLTAAVIFLMPCASAEDIKEIPESWFDDAVFIGDSIVGSLGIEVLIDGGLGEAQILYVNGLSCCRMVEKGEKIPYMGRMHTIGETVELSGANKVFLLFAMNDIGQTEDVTVKLWDAVLAQIKEAAPDVRIFLMSGTPIYSEHGYFTNKNMLAYNEILKAECEKLDCVYVDITDGLSDENGLLKKEFHKDAFHFTNAACVQWIKNLKNPENYSVDMSEEIE